MGWRVFQEDICSPDDVLDIERAMLPLARTVIALHMSSLKDIQPEYSQDTINPQEDIQIETPMDTQNSPEFDTITVNYRRRYSEDRFISNFNFNDQNYTFDETEEYQLSDNTESPQAQYSPVYTNELRIRGPYYHKNKIQFVTPFCKDGVLKSDNFEIYDTDEVDFPIELNENIDIDRYDRDKMNLDIQNNYDNVVESARDRENRIFYTCLCLGSFVISAIFLILYPL